VRPHWPARLIYGNRWTHAARVRIGSPVRKPAGCGGGLPRFATIGHRLGHPSPRDTSDAKLEETLSARADTRNVDPSRRETPSLTCPTSHPFYGERGDLFLRSNHGRGLRLGRLCLSEPVAARTRWPRFLLTGGARGVSTSPSARCAGHLRRRAVPRRPFAILVRSSILCGGPSPAAAARRATVRFPIRWPRAQTGPSFLSQGGAPGPDTRRQPCTGLFPDVPCPGPFHGLDRAALRRAASSEGCVAERDYCPGEPVNPVGQVAAFLVRPRSALRLYGPVRCRTGTLSDRALGRWAFEAARRSDAARRFAAARAAGARGAPPWFPLSKRIH
jgi:hypothetical protein